MFEKITGRKKKIKHDTENMFKKMYEKCNIERPKIDTIVGNPVKAYNKTIYPVVEMLTIGNRMQSFKGVQIVPIALVVEEQGNEYVISLTGEEINSKELIELKEKHKKK